MQGIETAETNYPGIRFLVRYTSQISGPLSLGFPVLPSIAFGEQGNYPREGGGLWWWKGYPGPAISLSNRRGPRQGSSDWPRKPYPHYRWLFWGLGKLLSLQAYPKDAIDMNRKKRRRHDKISNVEAPSFLFLFFYLGLDVTDHRRRKA